VKRMKAMNAAPIRPWIAIVRARRVGRRLPPNQPTVQPNSAITRIHSIMEALVVPPHAGDLVDQRLGVWELLATLEIEKSEIR